MRLRRSCSSGPEASGRPYLMRLYNSKGIFGNASDTAADLERLLQEYFGDYSIRITGCVAFFVGQS